MEDNFIVLNIGHAQTVHKWMNEDISSPFVRLFYVKSGRATIHLNGKTIDISAGHMYMIPGYTPHAYVCEPEFDFYYLFVYQKELDGSNFFDRFDFPVEVKANEGARLLFEHYCMLYPQLNLPSRNSVAFLYHMSYFDYLKEYMKMASYERLQLHGMVEILLSYFVKHAHPKAAFNDKRLTTVLDMIQQNINKRISIEDLAANACLTKSYLIRTFRQTLGISPLQYINHKKIQHAQTLLLGSEMSIQEIAHAVGMDDSSYFIRLFKKQIGFTPQEYRKRLIG